MEVTGLVISSPFPRDEGSDVDDRFRSQASISELPFDVVVDNCWTSGSNTDIVQFIQKRQSSGWMHDGCECGGAPGSPLRPPLLSQFWHWHPSPQVH